MKNVGGKFPVSPEPRRAPSKGSVKNVGKMPATNVKGGQPKSSK